MASALRLSGPPLPARLEPLSHAWETAGDVRLERVPDPQGVGTRLRIAPRFGPLPSSGPGGAALRAGLDLEPGPQGVPVAAAWFEVQRDPVS